jgi:epoxyqueuosine reductase
LSVEKAFFKKRVAKIKFSPVLKTGNEPNSHVIQSEFDAEKRAGVLKRMASDLGFSSCRIAKAGFLEEEAPKLESWLSHSHHGEMAYMENHFDMRLDPRLLVDNCRSVVTLAYSYFPEKKLFSEGELKVSTYAYGSDYHKVLKKKLKQLLKDFQSATGEVGGRVFVDSAPVLEKAWAARNGTGWLGKHTNIVHPKHGSFFFLCEMLLDVELQADAPMTDHCGTCTRCIDACPTDAIFAPYQLDASRCISYLTIELKSSIPSEFAGKMDDWIFGCDVCQDVCPWNKKFSVVHQEPYFLPHPDLERMSVHDWKELTKDVFDDVFSSSAVKRTGYEGLKRNIRFATEGSSSDSNSSSGNPA